MIHICCNEAVVLNCCIVFKLHAGDGKFNVVDF